MKFEFGVLVFVEEGKCREPREKRKIGENPGTLLRINSKCNSVITLDLITLMGGGKHSLHCATFPLLMASVV